ncbi:MAG: extracellular solute-binding protein [Chloroflexota bacterium]|nr:extracellular solute-binding protein [Chloroflexota bacterium]
MRTTYRLLCVLLVLAFSVGFAQAQDDLSSVDPSGQTVVYWHQFSDAQLETMTAIVNDFNTTNEWGITVEAVAQGNYNDIRELMNAGIISGELPNLVAGFGNDGASYFRDGAAVDLNTYVMDATWGLSEEDMAGLVPGILDANAQTSAPFNGELLAWPHQFSAQVMVSNQTLLSALGYDAPPTTVEEFIEVSCAAANSTGPNGEDVQGFPITTDPSLFESFVANQGGAIFADGAYTFTSEPVIASFQLYKDLYDQGCGYIPAERFAEQTDFSLGLTPYIATSTAGFTFVVAAFEESGVDAELVVSTFPHTEGNEALQIFVPSIIMVPSTPEVQLASWLFLKHLTTVDPAAQWTEGTGYFNPVAATAPLLTEENFYRADIFPLFSAANSFLSNEAISTYTGPQVVSYGAVRGLVSEAIANVTSNGMDVMEVAEALNEAANAAHEESIAG